MNLLNWLEWIWVTKCANQTLTGERIGKQRVWSCTKNCTEQTEGWQIFIDSCSKMFQRIRFSAVCFRKARLWLVSPDPGCSTSSSLTDLWGFGFQISWKFSAVLPSRHFTFWHVPLISEHSCISQEISLPARISKATISNLFKTTSAYTLIFFLHIFPNCWLKKSLTVQDNIAANPM